MANEVPPPAVDVVMEEQPGAQQQPGDQPLHVDADGEPTLPPAEPMDQTLDEMIAEFEREFVQETADMAELSKALEGVAICGKNDRPRGFRNVVISDKCVAADRFVYNNLEIRWVFFKTDKTLTYVVNQLLRFIEDPTPKRIVIDVFNQFLESEPIGKIMQAISQIRNKMWDNKTHWVVISSCLFGPFQEPWWEEVAALNVFIRNINLSLQVTPLQLHKALLKKVKGLKQLCCRGADWEEHRLGSGVGKTLSAAGIDRIKDWIGAHVERGMSKPVDDNTTNLCNEDSPAPLNISPGFKSWKMVQYLQALGTWDPESVRYNVHRRFSLGSNHSRDSDRSLKSGSSSSVRSHDDLRPNLVSASGVSKNNRYSKPRGGRNFRGRNNTWRQAGSKRDESPCSFKLQAEDLEARMSDLKREHSLENKKKKETEEKYARRCERLSSELEWAGHDRRNLEDKNRALEKEVARLTEDRERLRDLRDDWREKAKQLEERREDRR